MSEFILSDMTLDDLCAYVTRQLNLFFPDNRPVLPEQLCPVMGEALERTQISSFQGSESLPVQRFKLRAECRLRFCS